MVVFILSKFKIYIVFLVLNFEFIWVIKDLGLLVLSCNIYWYFFFYSIGDSGIEKYCWFWRVVWEMKCLN